MWMAWALRFELVILRWIKDSFFCVNDLEDGGKEVSNSLKSPIQVRRKYKHTKEYQSSLIRTKSPSPSPPSPSNYITTTSFATRDRVHHKQTMKNIRLISFAISNSRSSL